ncbi:MAG: polyphosphate kinase [Actinomycetota bacterium]|jgi:polyphosphate kinase|nr:polyphosphate kinase [Actinomycetota bacterium]
MSPPDTPTAPDSSRYLNRELSMLEFQARVLALAEDPSLPLLERAKFLAIFSGNIDEFFQVRVAGIKEQLAVGVRSTSPDGLDQVEQLRAIRARVEELVARQAAAFTKEIAPALQDVGVEFTAWDDLDPDAQAQLTRVFDDRIFPVLTPLAVDPAHPFPYISNLSLNLAVVVRDRSSGEERFARVKVPPLLPRFVVVPDSGRYVPLEQVIAAHLDALFPGMEVLAQYPFRVTRDADIELSDESEDLLAAMEMSLRQRTKFGLAVRLEVDTHITPEVLALLCRELELDPNDVYQVDAPLDLSGLWDLYGLRRPELKYPTFTPQNPPPLAGGKESDVFWAMRNGDVLLHHPYDSFANSVEAFVEQAASDDSVLAIKQALYRTGGDEAGIVASLVKAAEAGKQVVALVELKARFDEQANIERARMLEQAGAHVVYGLVGLKTHAKVLLVVRQEADGIRRYCHFGTGNYNPKTATTYEDLGVLSSDPDLGSDLSELFNHLTGYSRPGEYRRLLVAPMHLRDDLRDLIRGQAHPDGEIVMKINALVDSEIIDELYAASNAGAHVHLVVRSICCLRAGVPGLSENITVRSIVGRYLEHSRIIRFGKASDEETVYVIGSADMMPRNLDRRVEAMLRITDPRMRARLDEILSINFADDVLAWSLEADGTWHKAEPVADIESQVRFQELAVARSKVRAAEA